MRTKNHILLGSLLSVASINAPGSAWATASDPTNLAEESEPASEGQFTHDQQMVARIHLLNMHVIRLSQLAIYQSKSEQIKEHAKKFMADHLSIDQTLLTIAHRHQFYPGQILAKLAEIPSLRQEHRDIMTRLGRLEGKAFDQLYIETMLRLHEQTNLYMQQGWNDTKEPEIRTFVGKVLPILNGHVEQARQLQQDLNNLPASQSK